MIKNAIANKLVLFISVAILTVLLYIYYLGSLVDKFEIEETQRQEFIQKQTTKIDDFKTINQKILDEEPEVLEFEFDYSVGEHKGKM
jgi:hypothetical protein